MKLESVILRGSRGSQPAASTVPVGTLYGVTDEGNILERSTGSAWQAYSPTVATVPTGSVVQVVNTQTGAVATGTTIIPDDDTIPQITEGDEYMTLAVTPLSATNKLRVEVVFNGSNANGAQWMTAALFLGVGADALAAAREYNAVATALATMAFSYYMTAGGTSALTFRVRGGAHGAGTTTFNGQSGARKLGGVYMSSITITEIKA